MQAGRTPSWRLEVTLRVLQLKPALDAFAHAGIETVVVDSVHESDRRLHGGDPPGDSPSLFPRYRLTALGSREALEKAVAAIDAACREPGEPPVEGSFWAAETLRVGGGPTSEA